MSKAYCKLPTKKHMKGIDYVGALILEVEQHRENQAKRDYWLAKAKVDAGYSPGTSFDVVWDEALKALLEKRAQCNTCGRKDER
jgi:hypothetical protein